MDGRGGENLHKCIQLLGVLVATAVIVIACGGSGDTTEAVDAAPATSADPSTSSAAPTSTSEPDADGTMPVDGVPIFHAEENPDVLSAWGQLELVDGSLALGSDVTAYTLQSKLFSDNAQKLRTVWLPEGADPAAYDPTEVFAFPVGTVITKTFYYPVDADGAVLKVAEWNDAATPIDLSSVRLIETRILVHRADGWDALPYVWNEEQTEASLARTGDLQLLTLVDDDTGGEALRSELVGDRIECGTERFVVRLPDVLGDRCAASWVFDGFSALASIRASSDDQGASARQRPGRVGGSLWVSIGELHVGVQSLLLSRLDRDPHLLERLGRAEADPIEPSGEPDAFELLTLRVARSHAINLRPR